MRLERLPLEPRSCAKANPPGSQLCSVSWIKGSYCSCFLRDNEPISPLAIKQLQNEDSKGNQVLVTFPSHPCVLALSCHRLCSPGERSSQYPFLFWEPWHCSNSLKICTPNQTPVSFKQQNSSPTVCTLALQWSSHRVACTSGCRAGSLPRTSPPLSPLSFPLSVTQHFGNWRPKQSC